MKCKVELYVAGTVFYETVHARDYQEAKKVALPSPFRQSLTPCLSRVNLPSPLSVVDHLLNHPQQKSNDLLE